MFRIIPSYEETDLGLPYPVTIIGAAEEEIDDVTGERIGIAVPDVEGLSVATAVLRALHPFQLDGSEVLFIRRVLGMSGKDFAAAINIAPESLSRWENGKQNLGGWADKQVRMAALIALRDMAPALSADPKAVIGLAVCTRPLGEWPHFVLHRVPQKTEAPEAPSGWDGEPLAMAA